MECMNNISGNVRMERMEVRLSPKSLSNAHSLMENKKLK